MLISGEQGDSVNLDRLHRSRHVHSIECSSTVTDSRGLHSRPIVAIKELTDQHSCTVQLTSNTTGRSADGSSVMQMLLMCADFGEIITITGQRAEDLRSRFQELSFLRSSV